MLPDLWVVYIRRSYKRADSSDISDEHQEAAARALVPAGSRCVVISDSGGHQSGASAEREGYQRLLSLVASGQVAGIAVYDLSRLARNASLMLPLRDELERRQIPIRASTMPNSQWDGASGRFMFGNLCLAAQYQRDLDSERMVGLTRTIFEAGGHRGADPFGYRTIRDEKGLIIKPRALGIVPAEADVVRRVWRELASKSADDIARGLQVDGVDRRVRAPWTRDAVKDIVRRGRFYLGLVVYRRGAEERAGRHPSILDLATWGEGRKGVDSRLSGAVRRSTKHRTYLLSGLVECRCGARGAHAAGLEDLKPVRLHGQTRTSRGHEWRYYLCRRCDAPVIPANDLEAAVLDRLRAMRLPAIAIQAAREELRRRLALPSVGMSDERRTRLDARIERLKAQYEWGDIEEPEYRAKLVDTRSQLALLPEADKVIAFDDAARLVESLEVAIGAASPEQLKALIRMLVVRVTTNDHDLESIEIVPSALPFFAQPTLLRAPPDGLEPPTQALGRPRSVH